jgi:hypothetical protein
MHRPSFQKYDLCATQVFSAITRRIPTEHPSRCVMHNWNASQFLQTHASKYLLYIFRRKNLIGLQAAPLPGRPCPAPAKWPCVLRHSTRTLGTERVQWKVVVLVVRVYALPCCKRRVVAVELSRRDAFATYIHKIV